MTQAKSTSFFAPDTSAPDIKRKQALAQSLMQQGQQLDPNASVSGVVIKQNPLGQFARALTQGIGGYIGGQADREQSDMDTARAQKLASAIKTYGTDPNSAIASLVSDPNTADQGISLFGQKVNSDNLAQKESADLQKQIALSGFKADHPVNSLGFGVPVNPSSSLPSGQSNNLGAPPTDPNAPPLSGDDYLRTLQPNQAAVVKMIGDGNEKSSTILSRMSPADKVGVLAAVSRYKPNYSANQFGADQAFNIGKQGNTIRSLNVADQHLQLLSDLSDALGNGDIQIINKAKNAYKTATGQEAPADFNAARSLVADEVSKAVIGGATALGDRESVANQINSSSSSPQLRGVINTYRGLMAGQKGGLKDQYKRSTGKDDFDTLFSPSIQSPIIAPLDKSDPRIQKALDAGYTEDQIRAHLGK